MTTFELTWQGDPNRAPSDQTTVALKAKSWFWWIKAFLKGEVGGATLGLWTCEGSSDSSTAGLDAVDRWGAAFDASKIVRNTAGSAHSWIVLKSPVGLGPFYMCLDWSGNLDYGTNVWFSKTAFTGGTTLARPTSTTEWLANPGGTANYQWLFNSAAGTKFHGILSTTGEFHLYNSRDGQGFYDCQLSFYTLADTRAGEAHNGWSSLFYNQNSPGAGSRVGMSVSTSHPTRGRNATNSTTVTASWAHFSNVLSSSLMLDLGTTDATDSKRPDLPIYVYADTGGHKSIRGRIRDICWAPENAAPGLAEPTGGPPYESAVVGNHWAPYGGSVEPQL